MKIGQFQTFTNYVKRYIY